MNGEEISRVVRDIVERVAQRLENTAHGEIPGPADQRMFGERLTVLQQAVAEGATRLCPQALPVEQCLDLSPIIERILLRPDAREADVHAVCREAIQQGCAAVCVMLDWVEAASASLKGSEVRVSATIGFPAGAQTTEAKCAEVRRAVALGADEVDVVMNLGRLRAADYRAVLEDLQAAVRAAQGKPVKAVIEAAELTRDEKIAAAILAKSAGARFVKSSTGFGPDGISLGDVALIRAALAGLPIPSESAKLEYAQRVGAVVCIVVER